MPPARRWAADVRKKADQSHFRTLDRRHRALDIPLVARSVDDCESIEGFTVLTANNGRAAMAEKILVRPE